MPDKDDKNKGHTSLPDQYDRNEKEVHEIADGHKPSFKSANDREAEAPRNNEHEGVKKQKDLEEARSVPSSKQG
ncbi:hypothetical protein EHF33_06045 [Deinococcus psychrotolerans]|uniref:Uncharacterized protein n=2 Tax=Deinococcus TaxID=1298 RepID=A0A553V0E9_9DEIO|nr:MULTISPECIES: hypothetical protein [Deinococcus]AZI42367.1 hypothetical protein EHF33_06045 [Deinococcus psychrotolerans]TSA85922.1 hypothetical protein FNU79_09100 [Deinococcus detaillensis]